MYYFGLTSDVLTDAYQIRNSQPTPPAWPCQLPYPNTHLTRQASRPSAMPAIDRCPPRYHMCMLPHVHVHCVQLQSISLPSHLVQQHVISTPCFVATLASTPSSCETLTESTDRHHRYGGLMSNGGVSRHSLIRLNHPAEGVLEWL